MLRLQLITKSEGEIQMTTLMFSDEMMTASPVCRAPMMNQSPQNCAHACINCHIMSPEEETSLDEALKDLLESILV